MKLQFAFPESSERHLRDICKKKGLTEKQTQEVLQVVDKTWRNGQKKMKELKA